MEWHAGFEGVGAVPQGHAGRWRSGGRKGTLLRNMQVVAVASAEGMMTCSAFAAIMCR